MIFWHWLSRDLKRPWRLLLFVALLGVIGLTAYLGYCQWWASRHLAAATEALRRSDLTKARAHLLLCLEVWPDKDEVHLLLARTARRAGDYAEARASLDTYRTLGGITEHIDLEVLLTKAQRGELTDTEQPLWAYVHAEHPDRALILEALARGYLQTFRLPLALEAIGRWHALEPENVRAHFWAGEACRHLRSSAQAREHYRRTVELDPEHDTARLRLADNLLRASLNKEALEHYRILAKYKPGDADVLLGLASAQAALAQTDEARAVLDGLLLEYPGNTYALVQRAKLDLDARRPKEAEVRLRKAFELSPFDRETVYQFLLCLRQLRKDDEVPKLVARFEEIEAYATRLASVTEEMLKAPRDASLRCEAGEVFLKIGNDVEGLRWLRSALQEDPRHQATHRVLRDYFRRTGDLAQAAFHERALLRP
jgi:tetratricopeptide (TPR) repeat protein